MSSRDRLFDALQDPLNALNGDDITVSSSDLAELIRHYDEAVAALGQIAAPSFKTAGVLKQIATTCLSEALGRNVSHHG